MELEMFLSLTKLFLNSTLAHHINYSAKARELETFLLLSVRSKGVPPPKIDTSAHIFYPALKQTLVWLNEKRKRQFQQKFLSIMFFTLNEIN